MAASKDKSYDFPRDLKSVIGKTSLFKLLNQEQLETLTTATKVIQLEKHACVVEQGDVGDNLYWIIAGQVKLVFHSYNDDEKILEILGSDTCFGLGEMLLAQPHLATVKTTTKSTLLQIERNAIIQLAEKCYPLANELMVCLSRQFYGLVRDIESQAQPAKQRLAQYLMHQRESNATDDIELMTSKSLVASRLSLTPETLSRIFKELSVEGLIEVSGRRIKILNSQKMNALIA